MLVAQLLNGYFTLRNLSKVRGETLLTILANYLGVNRLEFQVFQNRLFLAGCVPLHLKGTKEILLTSMGATHLRREIPTSLVSGNVVH